MKKYLYFWIENYKKLNDGSSYLFEDFGINLSSLYNICHNWDSSKLEIEIEEKSDVPECFYSDNIVDLCIPVNVLFIQRFTKLVLPEPLLPIIIIFI